MMEYNLQEGIEKACLMVQEKLCFKRRQATLSKIESNVLVNVTGGSASGKTNAVSLKLKEIFQKQAEILSIDDYYRGKNFMKAMREKGVVLNWDQPEVLELELLAEHIKYLKQGLPVLKPKYSFKTGERQGYEYFHTNKIIIVEGLFMVGGCDIYVFVDVGLHGRILRRLFRDIERTNNRPKDILKYFSEVVEPMNAKYVDPAKTKANIVIKNEFNPVVEAKNSGLHEIQLKFWIESEEKIRNIPDIKHLEHRLQHDYYYNPKDRNLIETEEILRIRMQDDEKIIFTYKGPKEEHEFRKRSKFEFEIDEETAKSFVGIYGDVIKTIKKVRELYSLEGIIFSIDYVVSYEDGAMRPLGKFLEVRMTKDGEGEKIEEVLRRLGLKIEDGIKKSYFEM